MPDGLNDNLPFLFVLFVLDGIPCLIMYYMIPDGHICHNICYLWWFCLQSGPAVYRSRSVFEDATPEVVRDFFWDDEFRPKWDTMFAYVKILEECPHTGTMIVHWIRKVDEMNGSYNFVYWCFGVISLKHISYSRLCRDLHIWTCFIFLQFPFFCRDREYIIGRRIWEAGKNYYCVTKVLVIMFCCLVWSFNFQ